MHPDDLNLAFTRSLADALATLGLRHVCISPGSRNTPLIVAFAEHPDIRDWSHHDERNAGFFALGLAKASGTPVALVCTSGTAAAEYLPAVVEAHHARVPLLVLTADRPPELRDVGAPQAIDQVKLYGDAVKWYHGAGSPDVSQVRHAPSLAAHAWAEAAEAPAGPVHLDLAFREPLAPRHRGAGDSAGDSAGDMEGAAVPPRIELPMRHPSPTALADLAAELSGRRTLFVVGEIPGSATGPVATLAATAGAVVFADPQSGLRSGQVEAAVVATADLLTAAGALDRNPPEIIVRWGPIPTSKSVWRWLEDHPDVPQVVVDPGGHRDPLHSAQVMMRTDVGSTASALPWLVEPADEDWAAGWRRTDDLAAAALTTALGSEPFPNEPAVARTVMAAAPTGSLLFVGSSMPIRDIDAFGSPRPTTITILANRGASGIDGTISTALGATAAEGRPGIVLIGDVAALHDLSALADAVRLRIPLTIVVVHNDGGGIFGLLDQADPERLDAELFERHIGTPHGVDLVAVAEAVGMEAARTATVEELASLVGAGEGPRLVEIRTDRSELAPRRHRLADAVAASLG